MCSQACGLKWWNYVAITLEETVLIWLTSTELDCVLKQLFTKMGRFLGIITNLQKAMCVRVVKFPVAITWFRNEYWFRTQKICLLPTLSCWCEAYQIIMGRWLNLMTSRGAPGFPSSATGLKKKKKSLASAGDRRDSGWIPGSERSPGGGKGNPLQYSCLENPVDRKAWWATVHGSDTTEAT